MDDRCAIRAYLQGTGQACCMRLQLAMTPE